MAKDETINTAGMLVYMVEGKETPHFLSIFHGRMMIFTDEHKDSIPTRFLLHVTGNRQYNTKARQVINYSLLLEIQWDRTGFI